MADLALVFGTIGASQMISDLTRLEGKALSLSGVFSTVGKNLTGPTSIAAIGTVIKDTVADSIKAFADFEQASASLSSITGATGKDLEFFKEQAKDIGSTTTTSATEAVKAFELIGSAMPKLLDDSAALVQVTKDVQTLADASGMTLPDAAQAAVGALNQYGAAASEAGRFVNVLAAGALEGASPIQKSTQALEQFGSVAAGFNVSIEESIALVQTLADKNKMGAEAGTAVRNVLLKMQTIKALDKKALEDLERLGVNMNLVSSSSTPLLKRLNELKKISGDATAVMHVFGVENVNAANILLNNTARFNELTGAITGTNVATQQAATNTATLAASWKKIQNQIGIAMIDLGESFKPILDDLIKGFPDAFQTVKNVANSIIGPFKSLFGAIGDLASAFGIAKGEGSIFATIVDGLAFSIKFVTLPIELFIKGIAALVDWFAKVVDGIGNFIDNTPILREAIDFLLLPLRALGDAISFVTNALGFTEEKAGLASSSLAAWNKAVSEVQKKTGATNEQMHEFIKNFDRSKLAGFSQADAMKVVIFELNNFLHPCKEATEGVKVLGEGMDVAKKQTKKFADELKAITIDQRVVELMQELAGKDKTPNLDASSLPGRTMDSIDLIGGKQWEENFKVMEDGLERVLTFKEKIAAAFADLKESVKTSMISMAQDVAFNIGEAIGSGASIGNVFKNALRELAVMIPKMVGMAMINEAATVPSPASLPLAIAGLALMGLSGVLSGAFKAADAKRAAAVAPNVGGNPIPEPNRRGLESFGVSGGQAERVIIQIEGDEIYGVMRRGLRRENRRHG